MNVWLDLKAEADEIIGPCRDYIEHAIFEDPEKLTTKTAIAKGNRARAVRDLIETIEGARKLK